MAYSDVLCLTAASGTAPNGLSDTDAVKRAFTPPLVRTAYNATTLDGENLTYRFERLVTVTTSASALTFNVKDAIEVLGFDSDNNQISANIKLTATGGGQTVSTNRGFFKISQVIIPAQLLASGTMSVGVGDVVLKRPAAAIEVGTAGVVKLATATGAMDVTMPANLIREIAVTRIYSANATYPVILYR